MTVLENYPWLDNMKSSPVMALTLKRYRADHTTTMDYQRTTGQMLHGDPEKGLSFTSWFRCTHCFIEDYLQTPVALGLAEHERLEREYHKKHGFEWVSVAPDLGWGDLVQNPYDEASWKKPATSDASPSQNP